MTAKTSEGIGNPILVPFTRVYLDPNNPRIAPEMPPGYDDPGALFDDELQRRIEASFEKAFDVDTLEDGIFAQGWAPIDPVLVWEHPKKKKHYVVVEGNRRTVALRRLRGVRLAREQAKLQRIIDKPRTPKEEIKEQQRVVEQLERIVASTNEIAVHPVEAASAAELQEKLPVILGVRHITHAQQWSPYATNLYILSLYDRLFRLRHGEDAPLRIEADLVKQVMKIVSLKETKTRRNIQAASAFSRFKTQYEDQLPEGDTFEDKHQYFFEQILQSSFAQAQFEFGKDALELPKETADVLFQWAFSKPTGDKGEEDNPNILYKAENIGLWSQMKNFDDANGTDFAKRLDITVPEKAQPMRDIEADYLQRKRLRTPVNAFSNLIKDLRDLRVETLVSQRSHLEPLLEEAQQLITSYLTMMQAAP